MAPPRSKKRRPSFRRLLKTSGVKLQNKLQNRTNKQQNVAKKQRKEQKKMRAAVKDAIVKTPRPLETYRKTPEEELEEEEEFLETLPTDMMEEENLEEIRAMATQASFITRDLSACAPVHSGKKRSSEEVRNYEKIPRKLARTEEKEVIHLLPIKDKKRGVVPQSFERVIERKPEEEEEEDEEEEEQEENLHEVAQESSGGLTAEQIEALRIQKIHDRKLTIARLGSAVMSDPYSNIKRLKELRGMLMEIRPLTAEEKAAKVKKDTQQVRDFEEGLVSQYKFYLEDLEQTVKDWKQKKKKRSQAVSLDSYLGLAEVSIRCLCELLLALPHFNFHNNIIVVLVPLMNDPVKTVSVMCCDAFRKLFQQDKEGGPSLATVRVISGLVKRHNYAVRPEVLKTLLSLRIKEVQMKKDMEDTAPRKKFMNNKEKRKKLSRMQRKWKKAEEKLEKELLEAEASESKDKKIKLHTETLNIVFLIYFRIMKKAQKSVLIPAVLEGLANFAHLINLEFFDDLLNVMQGLIQSGDLSPRESLHCIQTVFTILSGQGDVLNIDPLNFYSQLYRILLLVHAGAPNDDIIIVLRCVDAMLTRRRKQVSLQRAMAFIKRLSTLSLTLLPSGATATLHCCRAALHAFPKCDFLLDNEVQGSGFFLPELNEPEHCNAQNTALWELHTLQRHFHPVVRRLASHLSHGAPSDGGGALGPELSRRTPVELFKIYSVKDLTFDPPAAPTTKKKDRFVTGGALLDPELQRQAESAMTLPPDTELDFTAAYTHTDTDTDTHTDSHSDSHTDTQATTHTCLQNGTPAGGAVCS
ncbi:hypothetical protein PBY51_001245 [Eleginops maclovinus]|uniref:Nucleolar complex protein 3 homolog n=1 Tax=Eleginops maclovinus TaxID=56733 RepID=A0AAN7WX24_ELEMC|nr:hypothetical protein PBY51_001245 [Eleginops maclovinus]